MKHVKKLVALIFAIGVLTYSCYTENTNIVYRNEYYVSSSDIDKLAPTFIAASKEFGVPASVMIALSIHETSLGTKGVGTSKNNLFGVMTTSLYPTPAGCEGAFECYKTVEDSIRDAARILGSPKASYKVTNIIIQNGKLDGAYEQITKSITAHWCTSGCTYDFQTLLNTIDSYNLTKYDTELKSMSTQDLKDLIEKYYGKNASEIPGFEEDKTSEPWNGNYETPNLQDDVYNGIYLNTTYTGNIEEGFVYKKYHEEPLWEEMNIEGDEGKVSQVIRNIFLQGEKIYGDGQLHLFDFQFNGTDHEAPIDFGDVDYSETGAPLSCYKMISSSFNNQESFRTAKHKGLDLAAPAGTKIYTVIDGTVTGVNSGCSPTGYYGNNCGGGYGNYVKIKGTDGRTYIYAHMYTTPLVSNGAKVTKGQQIGVVGSSGSSTGNHLHFEVRDANGTKINPLGFAHTELIPKC